MNTMTPKRTSCGPGWRKYLSLAERVAVVELAKGRSINSISKMFNCGQTQITNIIRSKIDIMKEWAECPDPYRIRRYQSSISTSSEALNHIVTAWINQCTALGFPLLDFAIQQTAATAAILLGDSSFDHDGTWLERFKRRNLIDTAIYTPEAVKSGALAISTIKVEDVIVTMKQGLIDDIINKANGNTTATPIAPNFITPLQQTTYEVVEIDEEENLVQDINYDDGTSSNDIKVQNYNQCDPLIEENHFNQFTDNYGNMVDDDNDSNMEYVGNLAETVEDDQFDETPTDEIIDEHNVNSSINCEASVNSRNTIIDYEKAIEYLKPLEEFVLMKSNFKAINYINNLEDLFKKEMTKN